MAFIEWNDSLSVQIPSIDRQHKTLIGYINKLEQALNKGALDRQTVEHILKGLTTYTTAHFMYEEMLFDRFTYERTEAHKKAHGKLFGKVHEYNARFKAGDTSIGPELLNFLKDWLFNHILKEDMAYSDYLLKQGVS